MHFSNVTSASESLGLVADWTHALNGNGELSEVLERLRLIVKAEDAVIVRITKSDKRASYIARSSAHSGKIWPKQPCSYAEAVIGDSMFVAKAGSVWKLSDKASCDLDTVCHGSEAYRNRLVEAVVCPMAPESGHADLLEFHYQHQPAEHDLNLIIMLIGAFASSWGQRLPGSISKKLSQSKREKLRPVYENDHIPILDVENPAKLSRCEFRVCSLLNEGMTVNVIAKTLSIGPATVRSHLSSIFSKTDVSNQVELLHRLNHNSAAIAVGENSGSQLYKQH